MTLKKFWKLLISFPEIVRASIALSESETLQTRNKYPEALVELLKSRKWFEGKDFIYHLNFARICCNLNKDHLAAIEETKKAIFLIKTDRKINENLQQYLLTYAKYMVGLDLFGLGEKDAAEEWRMESEKHYFEIKKIPMKYKRSFPMEWHVDFKL